MSEITVSTLVFGLLFVLKHSDGFSISKYTPLLKEAGKVFDLLTSSKPPATIEKLKPSDKNMFFLLTTIHLVAAKTVNGQDLDAAYDETQVGDDTLEALLKKANKLLASPSDRKVRKSVKRVKFAIDFCSRANCDGIGNIVIKEHLKRLKLPENFPSLVQKALDEYLKIEDVLKEAVQNDPKAFLISSKEDLKPLILSVAAVQDVLKNANKDVTKLV